jgi:hypothetical protein
MRFEELSVCAVHEVWYCHSTEIVADGVCEMKNTRSKSNLTLC